MWIILGFSNYRQSKRVMASIYNILMTSKIKLVNATSRKLVFCNLPTGFAVDRLAIWFTQIETLFVILSILKTS